MYQLIIFDVDGTFYDLDDVVIDNYNMQLDFYAEEKGLSKGEVIRLFDENNIVPYKSEQARSATEFFLRNGVEPDVWRSYRDAHSSPKSIHKDTAVSNALLARFAELSKLVLLSSNTNENIYKTLDWLQIDRSLFDHIFCSTTQTDSKHPFNKMEMIRMILDKYNLEAQDVLAIGDRYESDIRPLVGLGGDGVLIHRPAELEEVYKALSCGELKDQPEGPYRLYRP